MLHFELQYDISFHMKMPHIDIAERTNTLLLMETAHFKGVHSLQEPTNTTSYNKNIYLLFWQNIVEIL